MGIDYTAKLGFGFAIDDEGGEWEPPWFCDEYDYDLENWLFEISDTGIDPIYRTDNGERLPGITDEQSKEYWHKRREWLKSSKCPVDILEHGWREEPQCVACVPGTVFAASYGDPKPFTIPDTQNMEVTELLTFCTEHGIPIKPNQQVGWHLVIWVS